MSPDGRAALVLALAAVLATAGVTGVFWNRVRLPARLGFVLLALLSVTATVAIQLNRLTEAYPAAAGSSPTLTGLSRLSSGSRVFEVQVPGRHSDLTMPMDVYLPAAYRGTRERFPVIEALHGYPGSPESWVRRLDVQRYLDAEITAGRMAPTVVLMPLQTPKHLLDTECTNLRNGPQAETFLTQDVPEYARRHYRIRHERTAWALTGYSAGGFCALNLLLRHPGQYAAAASMSGYAEPGIRIGDGTEHTTNDDTWRLRHLPRPDVDLWLGWAADDAITDREAHKVMALAKAPISVTTAVVAHGGHSDPVWRQMEPPAFDWLSGHLARPLP